jgi:hypothetical protein
VITKLPNMRQLVPNSIASGLNLQGAVRNTSIFLRLDGKRVTSLNPGPYTFIVTDTSKTQDFRLTGPGVNKRTSVKGTGRATWTVTLRKGTYRYRSSVRTTLRGSFKVG